MNKVAEICLEDVWACASLEARQRIAGLARKMLKAPFAEICSGSADRETRLCSSAPNGMSAQDWPEGAASIAVPIRLSGDRAIGTLRVVDTGVPEWSGEDRDLLSELAACLSSEIELTLESLQREKAEAASEQMKTKRT